MKFVDIVGSIVVSGVFSVGLYYTLKWLFPSKKEETTKTEPRDPDDNVRNIHEAKK